MLCGSLVFCALAAAAQMPTPTAAQTQAPPSSAAQPPPVQPPEWKTYRYPADGFSASFPSEPVAQKQHVPTGTVTLELRNYTVATETVTVEVGVCDYGDAIGGGDPDAILEGAKNGAVSNLSARLLTSKKITLGVYPGIAFEAEAEQLHLSARIYLVGTMIYQTFVAWPPGKTYSETNRFLDSFQLIARDSP
jgi:glucose/arabinose dehydrogenase